MTDTPIRTHTTKAAQGLGMFARVPADWKPGTPVLVVAGLPEGAELRRLCDVPEGWEWQNDAGNWHPAHRFGAEDECTGYVLCRPKPVPAPPATERIPWREAQGRTLIKDGRSYGLCVGVTSDDDVRGKRAWFVDGDDRMYIRADDDGMVEVLVDPAPTGDDGPHDCTSCTTSWQGCNDELRETGKACCSACKVRVTHGQAVAQDRLTPPETQADTPAPEGRWESRSPRGITWVEADGWEGHLTSWALARSWHLADDSGHGVDAMTELVELVRRDRTPDPTAEEVYEWLFQSQLVDDATEMVWDGLDDDEVDRIRDVLAAVRALREGGR